MALLLVISNLAYVGHATSHVTADPGLCKLCVHPGKTDSMVGPAPFVTHVMPEPFHHTRFNVHPPYHNVIFYDYLSRAPPLS